MNNDDIALSETVADFHDQFEAEVRSMTEKVRDSLLEGSGTCTRAEILGQLMMEELFPHPCDPQLDNFDDVFKGRLTTEQKAFLVQVADHLGPDWAQALYHAAVFITKVA